MDLSLYVFPVRERLSNVDIDYLDDIIIHDELNEAYNFIDMIVGPEVSEQHKITCMLNLAAYYTYLNYTSIAEQRLGELPQTSWIRVESLLGKARACLSLISMYPLNEDLTLNIEIYNRNPAAGRLSIGILSTD